MAKISTAMVLAAGLGTRLRPITDNLPKPLVDVGGKPVIIRTLEHIAAAGIGRVVINTHFMAEMLQDEVNRLKPKDLEVVYSHEPELLETGGGVKNALNLLGDAPFLVINSDAVWLEERYPLLQNICQAFDYAEHDTLLAVVPLARVPDLAGLGDFHYEKTSKCLDRNGIRTDDWDVIYGSVHVTHPALIAAHPEAVFSLNKIWKFSMESNRLHGFLYDAPWAEIGTHVGLLRARELVGEKM